MVNLSERVIQHGHEVESVERTAEECTTEEMYEGNYGGKSVSM